MLADEGRMESHRTYWREALGGELPVLELQTDHPRPAVLTTNGGTVPLEVDATTAEALWGVCKECGTTMMRGALAAWAVVALRFDHETDRPTPTPIPTRA